MPWLMKTAEEAQVQFEMRQYRALMRDHITKLHEYGMAFLGPYCVIVGCSLERKQGSAWSQTHGTGKDEARHNL